MALDAERIAAAIVAKVESTGMMSNESGSLGVLATAIAEAVVEEITTYAEIPAPTPGEIIAGTVTIGTAPSTANIPILQPPIPPGGIK